MRFVFAGYIRTPGFHQPFEWIHRIQAYLGVLEALSNEHEVISIEQINYSGDHLHNGVQYHFKDFGKKRSFFPRKQHDFIKQLSPDVVLIHGMEFPLQVIQLRIKLGKQVRIIVQSHGKQTPSGLKKIVQRIADTCIDAYFFTSDQLSEPWLKQGLIANDKKIHEVMVGSSFFQPSDKNLARTAIDITGEPVFLWAGRLNHNKDPFTVIKAFLGFHHECPGATLYMIYQTDELLEKVQEHLSLHDTDHCIQMVGKVPHEDMQTWFNASDFFISSSHFEVFGAVVAEAMSCRCIPILTNIPSFRKITGDGTCGLLYEVGDAVSLQSVLGKIPAMDREAEKQKIQSHFQQQLSFAAIAKRIQEITASL